MVDNLDEVSKMFDALIGDMAVPRNIRKVVFDAKERLKTEEENNVKISAAIYMIESVMDDINMPSHARTQIWTIVSALEGAKK